MRPAAPNRTAPQVDPPPAELAFSRFPGDREIAWSRALPGPILPQRDGSRPAARWENRALAQALLEYHRSHDAENTAPLTRFLGEHPGSRYEASLLTNLGVLYKQQGRISLAFPALARAWSLSKDGTDPHSRAVANWALAEAAEMHAHLDPATRAQLDAILDHLGGRDLHGPATEKVRMALAGRAMRTHHPEEAFRCGPVSLQMLRAFLGMPRVPEIERAVGSAQGFSLAGLEKLANTHGMKMRAMRREAGAPVPVPAIIHWKYDHYSAILDRRQQGGKEYFRIQNPLLDRDHWMSREALEEEASGYYLVSADQLPPGWRPASQAEARDVWGRCEFVLAALDQLMDAALKALLCLDPGPGMPQYNFHLALASLNITDIPLGYTPPVGPPVQFRITYNQRESFQPAIFNYSNLGPKWTFSWLSHVGGPSPQSIPFYLGGGGPDGRVYLRNGGVEQYAVPRSTTTPGLLLMDYGFNSQSHAHLLLNTPLRTGTAPPPPDYYERQLPDGSKEIFGQRVLSGGQFAYFLTQLVDPAGNAVKFTYDSQVRIISVTDAIGQVTTLSYGLPADPLKVTKVTDPFGRSTTLSYDADRRLAQVTDVLGMTTTFTYGQNDFISAMTTPYGRTGFQTGHGSLDMTPDPSYTIHAAKYPTAADDPMNVYIQATDPNGDTERVEFCNFVSTLPQRDNWNDSLNTGGTAPIPFLNTRLSFYWDKKAWKQFPGDYSKAKAYRWLDAQITGTQSGVPDYIKNPLEGRVVFRYPKQTNPYYQVGTSTVPVAVMRLLEDGRTQQTTSIESNDFGRVTRYTDPTGRQTTFTYDAAGTDLLESRNPATNELLAKISYTKPHLPASFTDASGQVTTYTYNSAGQVLTITDPKQQTTRYTYDQHGYLTQITGPLPAATFRLTYDTVGRVQTATDPEGYILTYSYDALDRVTKVTYPDKSIDQITYDKLDAVAFTDRQGRVTRIAYDALRHPVSITDPMGRTTGMGWCSCGALVSMTDPAGNVTTWNRDVQNRVTSKILADGSTTQYTYDPMTGRLIQLTDPSGQVATMTYLPDGNLAQVVHSNTSAPVDPITFTYDPNYNRLTSLTDGTGTTSLAYGHTGLAGAMRLASVTGPRGENVTYSYDELGRMVARSVDGVALTLGYDPLGRITSETNALGRFVFNYVGATGRLQSSSYPNRQSARYSYFDNLGDQRLKQILNQAADQSVLSQFDFTYLSAGEIRSLTTPQRSYNFSYDAGGQLTGVNVSGGSTFAYSYDAAGNRIAEQIDAAVAGATYNGANQLVQLDAQQLVYDANGNLLGDGTRTFEWDVRNRLTAVNSGTHRSEFLYDALDRRIRIVEKESGELVHDNQLIWCGASICEQRDPVTGVTRRFFAEGETQIAGGVEDRYYYTRDHLGSVREVTDSTGAVVASYDYDAWGRTFKLSGSFDAAFGYAGYYVHPASGLYLTQYRAYDPNLGRWVSRDPAGESGGANLYAYVGNSPQNAVDPLGLMLQGSVQATSTNPGLQLQLQAQQDEDRLLEGVRCRAKLVFGIATFVVGSLPALEQLFVGGTAGALGGAATGGPGTSVTAPAGTGGSVTTVNPGGALVRPPVISDPVPGVVGGDVFREWAREKLAQGIQDRATAESAALKRKLALYKIGTDETLQQALEATSGNPTPGNSLATMSVATWNFLKFVLFGVPPSP
jgi:RHS repeat-associated protein